jgi:hypothetical protein
VQDQGERGCAEEHQRGTGEHRAMPLGRGADDGRDQCQAKQRPLEDGAELAGDDRQGDGSKRPAQPCQLIDSPHAFLILIGGVSIMILERLTGCRNPRSLSASVQKAWGL